MEPSSLLELARSQGPVFWVAAVAIALGTTLLVMALAQFLRSRLAAGRGGIDPARSTPPPAASAADVYVPTTPPVAMESAPRLPAGPPLGDDHSLALLLRRLQSAGDRLEEVAGDLWHDEPGRNESALKDPLGDVEYVFRASGP